MNKECLNGPLTALKVLELGHFVAAPFAARLLADLGADVIKVEPTGGDPVRGWGEQVEGRSLWWSMHGRNKRSLAVNLKDPRGIEIVKKLVRECDVVIENFRPGQLAKMGLGNDVLRSENPGLIIAHISGYGQNGPYRDRAAFGVIAECVGGLRHLTNQKNPGHVPPVRVGVSIGDSVAGIYAAFGIVAALWQRDRQDGDSAGLTLDVALTEAVLSLMEGMLPEYGMLGKVKQPTGGAIATAAPSNAYPTRDGSWILIAANSEPLFGKLARLMGREEWISDARFASNQARVSHADELDKLIGEWTIQHEVETLIEMLNHADVPNCKIYTAADCASDPQYLYREAVVPVADPLLGPVLHAGVVPVIEENPGLIRWAGPMVGEHSDEILRSLGFSGEDILGLSAEGVVACPPTERQEDIPAAVGQ